MDNDTPPKRITRARAAAKIKAEPELKITTAAAKAKVTRATSTKRKTRSDDTAQEASHESRYDDEMNSIVNHKATRGKPKKAIQLEAETDASVEVEETLNSITTKVKRGRHKKIMEESPAPEQIRSTRGRPRKVDDMDELTKTAPELFKKTVRTRAVTAAKAASPKKSVKFQEPDKENVAPCVTAKVVSKSVEVATGLKAKPVRKPARVTRGRTKIGSAVDKKSPLSPKKATQITTSKETISEDELSTMEKTDMKPLMKSPVKAPGKPFSDSKKPNFVKTILNGSVLPTQDPNACLMASPARRPPASPFKESLKTSPKRANPGDFPLKSKSPFKLPTQALKYADPPSKISLLQSPARHPQSPAKVFVVDSPTRASRIGETPKANAFSNTTAINAHDLSGPHLRCTITQSAHDMEGIQSKGTSINPFPGRLSAVLPRHADLTLQEISLSPINNPTANVAERDKLCGDQMAYIPMAIDEVQDISEQVAQEPRSTTPTHSPPRHGIREFGSNFKAQDTADDSDSEDELSSTSAKYSPARLRPSDNIAARDFVVPSTPSRSKINKTPRSEFSRKMSADGVSILGNSQSFRVKNDKMAFTPLTWQFVERLVAGSSKLSSEHEIEQKSTLSAGDINSNIDIFQPSPVKSSFFEDEMSVREGASHVPVDDEAAADMIELSPATIDEEDLELAAEADGMSLALADNVEEAADTLSQSSSTRALSECSQEYGDENALPIDHTLQVFNTLKEPPASSSLIRGTATPVPVFGEREIKSHTISKVPLKPAGTESPSKPGKGFEIKNCSISTSRPPLQRMIPPSPAPPASSSSRIRFDELVSMYAASPSKTNNSSTAGNPICSPRRHLESQILKGAIVYVDVHTTEGADASAVFVDLLGQMGAKCIKSWNWNPSSSSGSTEADNESNNNAPGSRSGNKIGITHVVFKDGGKRTLEKVRESKGVVLCVGVGWVLE